MSAEMLGVNHIFKSANCVEIHQTEVQEYERWLRGMLQTSALTFWIGGPPVIQEGWKTEVSGQ